jgi:transposase
MRGKSQSQPDFLTVVNLNASVPSEHPLRPIKRRVEAVLQKLSPLFDDLYAAEGRPSIPSEQLLKARVLTALYSVRSERLFCEQLGYNLLWLWFLDREFSEGSFDHSIFAKNYQRVLSADVAKLFFAEVYDLSRQEGWTSDEHFTVDGTLIESWASLKSFVGKDGADARKVREAQDEDPGNPTVDFHGEKRCNDTHQSTTDPQSVLYLRHGVTLLRVPTTCSGWRGWKRVEQERGEPKARRRAIRDRIKLQTRRLGRGGRMAFKPKLRLKSKIKHKTE